MATPQQTSTPPFLDLTIFFGSIMCSLLLKTFSTAEFDFFTCMFVNLKYNFWSNKLLSNE